MKIRLTGIDQQDCDELAKHLRSQYEGIFDEKMIQTHLSEFIDTHNSSVFVDNLVDEGHVGKKMLDIGSGYGANVFSARERGIDAYGIDIAPMEIEFARRRLRRTRPQDDAEQIYLLGNGQSLPFDAATFDLVTIMNVLEHVPDYRRLLDEASRVLRPAGCLYIVCPNYAAFRSEAHYHVPWIPMFPRALAIFYLRSIDRNPAFFESSIFYCSNWGVLAHLVRMKFRICNPQRAKLDRLNKISSRKARMTLEYMGKLKLLKAAEFILALLFINPFKTSINLKAIKHK